MSGMSDPMEMAKKLVDALESVIDTYDPTDDTLEDAANFAYAQDQLEKVKKEISDYQTKPLPEERIWELIKDINTHDPQYPIKFARVIEQQHSIGVSNEKINTL
jgi:hypothetical protein